MRGCEEKVGFGLKSCRCSENRRKIDSIRGGEKIEGKRDRERESEREGVAVKLLSREIAFDGLLRQTGIPFDTPMLLYFVLFRSRSFHVHSFWKASVFPSRRATNNNTKEECLDRAYIFR